MPEIFSKTSKIKVIQYGDTPQKKIDWAILKNYVQALIPGKNKKAS